MNQLDAIAFVKAFYPDLPEWQIKIFAKMVEHQGPLIFRPISQAKIYKLGGDTWRAIQQEVSDG